MAFIKMVSQFMRRFLRSSTKPAASRNRPLRQCHHCQPVCTGLGQSGRSSSSFRLCILRHVLCGCGGVCGRSVSRCSAVLCRGIRGHGGVCRGHLRGGRDVRLVGRVRSFRGAGRVRFTVPGQFGQHHMLGLAALVNAADVVCIAVCIQRGSTLFTSFQSCRSLAFSLVMSMLGSFSMYLRLWTVW